METRISASLLKRMKARFTRDGSAALESRIAAICQDVARRLRRILPVSTLEAIALGGGYGRGEGGVLKTPTGDTPYNDVEFFVFVRGSLLLQQHRWGSVLHQIAHEMTEAYGIEIEFKMLTLAKLRQSPPSMFYYDLVMGHHWALGDDSLLVGCTHHRDASLIPLHEATRLLMNRSSGLLFAKHRLTKEDFSAEDADYVARNLAKAQLALGDVLLTAHGHYHWSCLERRRRLISLDLPLVSVLCLIPHHTAGVKFKLHPHLTTASREELATLHQNLTSAAQTLFLWLESRRLRHPFQSVASYTNSLLDKCPETDPLRNRLINARQFGLKSLLDTHYPRQRLLHGLCELLWKDESADRPSMTLGDYERLWNRFN